MSGESFTERAARLRSFFERGNALLEAARRERNLPAGTTVPAREGVIVVGFFRPRPNGFGGRRKV